MAGPAAPALLGPPKESLRGEPRSAAGLRVRLAAVRISGNQPRPRRHRRRGSASPCSLGTRDERQAAHRRDDRERPGLHGEPRPVVQRPDADRREGRGVRGPADGLRHGAAGQPGRLRVPARHVGLRRVLDRHAGVLAQGSVLLHPRPGPVRAGDGLLLDRPCPDVPAVARVREHPARHRARALPRQGRPVRWGQQLPDRQAVPDPARQGWRRRRRGRRGDRPRVRARGAPVAGARVRPEPGRRRDRRGVR